MQPSARRPRPALAALTIAWALATSIAVAGCGDSGLSERDAAGSGDSAGADAPAPVDASETDAAPPPPCEFDDPRAPTGSVLWAPPLSGTGAQTLGGHGHDDGFGPLGFCVGTATPGQPFYRLVAAGFETDTDVTGDGDVNDPLPIDFWRDAGSFNGVGESAGRVNIYIEVIDETDQVLDVDTAPDIRFVRTAFQGPVDILPLTSKPANEFQTNVPMVGGGVRYGIAIQGASDQVLNMRLPVNHHVTYALVFRRISGGP